MFSRKIRIQLILVLFCLLFIDFFVLSPKGENAADKRILKETDLMLETGRYPEAIELLNSTLNFHSEENIQPFLERLETAEKLNASSVAYSTAMRYYNEGNHETALTYFKKVIPEDVDNFTSAREKICELDMSIVRDTIKEKKAAAAEAR